MKQLNQMCLPFILLLIIIIVFIVLLIINHSELLDNDRNYSFQEAIQKQTDSSVLNTVDRDGEFVNANSREIERQCALHETIISLNTWIFHNKFLCQNKKLKDVTREWYS